MRGLDFATAVLYDRLVRSPEHSTFISARTRRAIPHPNRHALVSIAPGAFYGENKNTGAEGARITAIAET